MRHEKTWAIVLGVIWFIAGIIVTSCELAWHDTICDYDMNPICFFWALRWAVVGGFGLIGCLLWDE